ncbi:hypothetical protein KSF_108610 [Reticulibacter mediterranei]|uniref:Helicase ATP-binding domain-containing protein n=1 Tax=Reticulibacter mediterranei TaxID=2778369 RepID=A0A8J3IYG5_9CHLR|nr:integrase repeat-containing protein [Reticulibacter mediterranei]GHP00814.1 hypothetical protein KSF_108610 [Reticulibacter mediterranei]
MTIQWRPFAEARDFVRSLKLTSYQEWKRYCRSGRKPVDVPDYPDQIYRPSFLGMRDWLGIDESAPSSPSFRSFEEARAYVHSLHLKNYKAWRVYCQSGQRPKDIPCYPDRTYTADFIGWGDWLGNGELAKNHRIFQSFQQARAFVHTLCLRNRKEWNAYCRSGNKPADIPAVPSHVYGDAFVSMGDWLGSGTVAPQNKTWRPFAQARSFVHTLGLQNSKEWSTYCRSGNKPADIPAAPSHVYGDAFVSMGDWLGNGMIAHQNKTWRPFAQARSFVRTLGLRNKKEWKAYCCSGNKPEDIPSAPDQVYGDAFVSMGDWVGTDFVASSKRVYRSFLEARAFVRTLGLASGREWSMYCRSGNKPEDIPATPRKAYQTDFVSMGDWLGTHTVASQYKMYRPFQEARAFVHTLELRDEKEWSTYCRSGNKPEDIPATPRKAYQTDFISIGDWLGTHTIATFKRSYRCFQEARDYVRALRLTGNEAWRAYCQSGQKPADIPSHPDRTYQSDFKGWGDWLGIINKWNSNALLSLLEDLQSALPHLSERELYIVLQQGGALPALRLALGETSVLPVLQRIFTGEGVVRQALQKLSDEDLERLQEGAVDNDALVPEHLAAEQSALLETVLNADSERAAGVDTQALPQRKIHLHLMDRLAQLPGGLDDEAADYLVASRVSLLWDIYSAEGSEAVTDLLGATEEEGHFFLEVKRRFMDEVETMKRLDWTEGWAFAVDGQPARPNVMQRRIASMIQEYRRVGNWSGVGAGKTISALLSARVCKAHMTLVVTNYATVAGWQESIAKVYPDSLVSTDLAMVNAPTDPHQYCYLILNYEKFQGSGRHRLVEQLLRLKIDFIVLDEVQLVKQRDRTISQRSLAVGTLIREVAAHKSDLRVLAMSATPVINTLLEAKRLLELTTGIPFPDLGIAPTVNNALAMHRALLRYGFRFRPPYEQEMHLRLLPIRYNELPETLAAAQSSALALEQALLPAKLDAIQSFVRPGTLISTQYVEGILPVLEQSIRNQGFSVGFYTGADKSGLQPFLDGKIDVLLGSSAISTGLDGLQQRCDRIIVVSLPWTGAAFEQIIGRARRQGSRFKVIEIIVPQIILEEDGARWSWDEYRWDIISAKRSLSDCVLDGRIPEVIRFDEQTLLQQSRRALQAWIDRVKWKETHRVPSLEALQEMAHLA